MCIEKTPWEQVIDFHGHTCPEIALGFRIAQTANHEMGIRPSADAELIAETEILSCAIDALQILNRCTVGRGNLVINNQGNHNYKFYYTGTDSYIKISVEPSIIQMLTTVHNIDNTRQKQNKTLEAIQHILTVDEFKFCSISREQGILKKIK